MRKRKLIMALVLATSVVALAGCGDKDEAPVTSEIKQTKAMVPESVTEIDLDSATDSHMQAADVRPEGYQGTPTQSTEHPVANTPEPVGEGEVGRAAPPAREVEQIPAAPPVPNISGPYSLQLGSFTVLAVAEEKAANLRELGYPATIEQAEVGGQLYHRLFIRGLADRKSAEKLGEDLHSSLGLSYLVKLKLN